MGYSRFAYSRFAYSHFAYSHFAQSRFAYSQMLSLSHFAYTQDFCTLPSINGILIKPVHICITLMGAKDGLICFYGKLYYCKFSLHFMYKNICHCTMASNLRQKTKLNYKSLHEGEHLRLEGRIQKLIPDVLESQFYGEILITENRQWKTCNYNFFSLSLSFSLSLMLHFTPMRNFRDIVQPVYPQPFAA